MHALAVDGLHKSFDGDPAVDDISLTVPQGEFFSLIGPSGCGKTTTLRMLAGLLTPDAGRVMLNGEDVTDRPARERETNTVFQDLVLFPHMTVAENVGYGLARSGVTDPERGQRVDDALALPFSLTDRESPFLEAFATDRSAVILEALADASGGDVRPFGAAAEASYFAVHTPTVIFGPGVLADEEGPVAHADREYVQLSDVGRAGDVLTKALRTVFGAR